MLEDVPRDTLPSSSLHTSRFPGVVVGSESVGGRDTDVLGVWWGFRVLTGTRESRVRGDGTVGVGWKYLSSAQSI